MCSPTPSAGVAALVLSHVAMGSGMALAGLVTTFPLLVVSQCVCGLGWALASGADVAWLSDELDDPVRVDHVLTAQARWELVGGPAGMLGFGVLAFTTTLSTAIVMSGVAMVGLAVAVGRWPEDGFVPADPGRRRHEAVEILHDGARLARLDRAIGAALLATLLLNGGQEGYGRLQERRLLSLGFPTEPDPIVWFTAVGLVGYSLGAIALRVAQRHLEGERAPQRLYAAMCAVGAVGLVVFAHAPSVELAVLGVLLVSGLVSPVCRVATTIWVNRRATRRHRATVHSFVSQAEHLGEAVVGTVLAVVASGTSMSVVITASAVLFAAAGLVVRRSGS